MTELENTLHDFTTQLETQLGEPLLAGARRRARRPSPRSTAWSTSSTRHRSSDALNDLISSLEGILGGAADAAKEIGDALQQTADQIKNVSFAPITDEVIHEIDAVTDSLKAIDTSQLTPPLQLALQAALAVLPEDLSPITDPLVDDFDQAVEQSAVPALDEVRREPAAAARPGQAVRADDADRRRALDAVPAAAPGDERRSSRARCSTR